MNEKMIETLMWVSYGACYAVFAQLFWRFMRTRYVRARKCGHMTSVYPKKGEYVQRAVLRAFGEAQEVILKTEKPDYCRKCMNQKAVKCFRCGRPIFFDDPYALVLISPMECLEGMGLVTGSDGKMYAARCVRMETRCQVAPGHGARSAPYAAAGRWESV